MAHYAFIDSNNVVLSVMSGKDENESGADWESYYSKITGYRCLRTSYNTIRGTHLHGKEQFRYNYAGIGYIYIEELDAFIPPKTYSSWVLDESIMNWVPPMNEPTNKYFYWDDVQKKWVVVTEADMDDNSIKNKVYETNLALQPKRNGII